MALGGFSDKSVHACRGTSTGARSNSAKRHVAPSDLVTNALVIGFVSSERGTKACRNGAGTRVAEIIDAARGQTRLRMHLWVQSGIARQEQQVVPRHVQPRRPASRQDRQVELVLHGDILQPQEGAALDPA